MSEPAPQVSVIVPVRNNEPTIHGLLDALAGQAGIPFEVIVVVNDSSDRSASIVREHGLPCQLFETNDAGAYRARNTGARLAIAPVLAFTDADCAPEPHWLQQGVAALGSADLVGGSIHQVVSAQPSVWEHYDATFYLRQRDNVDNGFAATANAFVSRATFEELGGFDDNLISGGDHEFAMRLRSSGRTVRYAPDAVVRHRARASAAEVLRTQRRIGAGWRDLSRSGHRPSLLADKGLRPGFAAAREQVDDTSPLGRRSRLYPAHGLVTLARLVGRVTGH